MKKSHIAIYSLLLLSLIIIISIFLYQFKKTTVAVNVEENTLVSNEESLIDSSPDLTTSPTVIENIQYVAMDVVGNKFEIRAEQGTTNSRNYDEISLKGVVATIWLKNSESINITSSFANYNKSTVETLFKNNVTINYIDHKIESNKLHLSFKDKLANITNNVIYKGNNTNLYTDNIEIDFKTKKTKIFMNEKNKKIFVKSTY